MMRRLRCTSTTWSRPTSCAAHARLLWSITSNTRTGSCGRCCSATTSGAGRLTRAMPRYVGTPGEGQPGTWGTAGGETARYMGTPRGGTQLCALRCLCSWEREAAAWGSLALGAWVCGSSSEEHRRIATDASQVSLRFSFCWCHSAQLPEGKSSVIIEWKENNGQRRGGREASL